METSVIPKRGMAPIALVLLLAGCGGDGANRGSVSGKVTLNGAALESGSISFVPIEGTQSPSSGATIANGSYEIPRDKGPMVGKYQVVITSSRKTGKKIAAGSPAPAGTMIEEVVEAVPAIYNVKSTLRGEVKPGSNTFDYELKAP